MADRGPDDGSAGTEGSDGDTENKKRRVADGIAQLLSRMQPLQPDLLRATQAHKALRALRLAHPKGIKEGWRNWSYQTQKIRTFWSHSWHGQKWKKYITLLLLYNGTAASVVSCLGAAIVAALNCYHLLPIYDPERGSFWAPCVGLVLFVFTLLFWRSGESVFLDLVSIDQDDPARKLKGLLSMGAFLKHSASWNLLFSHWMNQCTVYKPEIFYSL